MAFYYLRKKAKLVTHRYTTADSHFCQLVEKTYKEWDELKDKDDYDWTGRHALVEQILAERPRNRAERPWVKAGTIYVPVHVKGNHWVLAVISIPERSVTVYDSLLTGRYAVIDHMAELIPIILCKRVWDIRTDEYHSSLPFDVVYASFMPQQRNG